MILMQEIHLEACKKANQNPQELAKRLFLKEISAEYDTFYNAVLTYADILGKEGVDVYRQLAQDRWNSLPSLNPGDKDDWSSERFHLTHIMEVLAEQEKDVEKLVEIKSKDLSSDIRFLAIAEIYKKAGNIEKALGWAEKGLNVFPEKTHSSLRDFLAEEYHCRGRHDEAMILIWKQFEESPSLEDYKKFNDEINHGKGKTKDAGPGKIIDEMDLELTK